MKRIKLMPCAGCRYDPATIGKPGWLLCLHPDWKEISRHDDPISESGYPACFEKCETGVQL